MTCRPSLSAVAFRNSLLEFLTPITVINLYALDCVEVKTKGAAETFAAAPFILQHRIYFDSNAACAAARRATGTRLGLHET